MHTHPMANLAFGGKLIHGAPDVGSLIPADNECKKNVRARSMEHALCDDRSTHAGLGTGNPCGDFIRPAVIDAFQDGNNAYRTPDGAMGAPDFVDWPRWNDITHQKMWFEWIQRAHSGGLRVLVALALNNQTLAAAVCGSGETIPADDKGSGDLQIEEIRAFVDRHPEFMKLAESPKELRSIVEEGLIGVVIGIELDAFGNFHKGPIPTLAMIKDELVRLHAKGVRYIFPIHAIDNKLGGTAVYQGAFNTSNKREYGEFWDLVCSEPADKITYQFVPSGFDLAVAAIKVTKLRMGPTDDPPTPPLCDSLTGHVNNKGLTPLGESALNEMMKLGLMIDIDHMSQKSADRSLKLAGEVESGGYPLNSGHNGPRSAAPNSPKSSVSNGPNENQRTNEQLQQITNLGGMLGLGISNATPESFISAYTAAMKEMRNRPIGLGTDINGLVVGPQPTAGSVTYDSEFPKCKTRNREWDYNDDGVAHYGMLPDFLRAVIAHSDGKTVNFALNRSANAFVQMWERCEAQKSKVK
jgi:microsomal dipeptidase-like Zn-dependent dipeptidase